MREGYKLRHEKPTYRNPKPPFEPAPPRGNEYEYVYQYKDGAVFIMHEGVSGPEKAETFIASLDQYRTDYCTFVG